MANIRKLSAFRQLSLNCESPTTDKRRKSLKKQFSEDFCEVKGAKTRDRPPHPIKIAWAETDPESPKEEGVIAKKCIKVKKTPKLTKHSSLEKESILYSKQELAERLRQALKEREQEKPNLNIFLAHNTNSNEDEGYNEEPEVAAKELPKITPPLLTPMENTMKNVFQIRKSKEIAYPPPKSSAVVVIPIVEKEDFSSRQDEEAPTPPSSERKEQDPKAIKNVIIRPATAAAKRERFQKRTSTAFNSVVKDATRPPLVRSSSAPAKPEKPKFLATKRKIKSGKRSGKLSEDEDGVGNKENPKNQKEMNRYVPVNGNEIVTMVSLISPAASDNEEAEEKPKAKSPPVKKEEAKNLSLRKTVKSGELRAAIGATAKP
ncbi:hypothetical protein BDFB_007425 [Asbolus verrucosus]|uniref:Uncharacterized protein n=1 Tax=Asbolus verrucosus TaxID=1661398 RepID=A0A482VAG3_ASBVE|nr:hypothetical protein BDFB_007425 [Asbolus verrucosus]